MRNMTAERAAKEITRAYEATQPARFNEWMPLTHLVAMVDLTNEEITAGVLHLMRTEERFTAIPESNQKTLTTEDRSNALWIGGQWKHLIAWS